jgi:integrase
LRLSETIGLRRDELDLDRARLWVRRLEGGLSVEQPIAGDELRAIKRYLATRADALPWLFVSERRQPLTRQGGLSALSGHRYPTSWTKRESAD